MARELRRQTDDELMTALMDALRGGSVEIEAGRIVGHAGYYSPTERMVALNPDASDDEARGTLLDALGTFAPARPRLRLIHGGK